MKYYKVTAKCGHVGNGMFCIKNFYVKAKSKKEARNLVRTRPRVKKGMKNCTYQRSKGNKFYRANTKRENQLNYIKSYQEAFA